MVPERAASHYLLPAESLFGIIVILRTEWQYIHRCNDIGEYHNNDEAEKIVKSERRIVCILEIG